MSFDSLFSIRTVRVVLFAALALCAARSATAGDIPVADNSALSGIVFEDKPMVLPIQRNFQMAMITASSEIGRSCGTMEAYGWRLGQTEQDRVNQVFNNSVDQLRAQGYTVETKKPSSVSRDITIFTADGADRHFLFMWSAGEVGLVMVMCETPAPIGGRLGRLTENSGDRVLPANGGVLSSAGAAFAEKMAAADRGRASLLARVNNKSPYQMGSTPVGKWVGSYTCSQGNTGGTLYIDRLRGERFEGKFSFYPTPHNPYIPRGSYSVSGEYDADTQRILVNPGKWIERPSGYYNTVMIGSFDVTNSTFSGYFQGINGCTSFEAHYVPNDGKSVKKEKVKEKKAVVKKKKKSAAKKPVKENTESIKVEAPINLGGDAAKTEENIQDIKVKEPAPLGNQAPASDGASDGKSLGDSIVVPGKPEASPAVEPASGAN